MSGRSCKLVPTNAWLSAGCVISTVRGSPFASRCCARSTPTPARGPMGLPQRRAARPGDRPARHRPCAPDQSDACLGGRPRRKGLHASPPPGRHRTASHGRSWSHDAAHQRRTDRRAPGTPSPRGQALPDPPAREEPGIQGGRGGERVTGIVNAHGWVPPCLPRLWRGRARQRLAPTGVGGASPVGHPFATGGRPAHVVGVRRCLTRRPEGPGMGVRRGRMPTVPSDMAVRMIVA
jgi:hypothetical protein